MSKLVEKRPRAVITGIGLILPGATTVDQFWDHLVEGRSQIDFITRHDTTNEDVKVAAEIKDFNPKDFDLKIDPKFIDRYTRETLITMAAVKNAYKDARLNAEIDPTRISFIDSSSRGAMAWWHDSYVTDAERSLVDETPFNRHAILQSMASNATTLTAMALNIQGFVTCISSACVGGHHSISLAAQSIQSGMADVCFAGGHDFPIFKPLIRIYSDPKARALTLEKDNPTGAMRPWDKSRDGFVMGEGAIVLCLERYDHAVARGATIYSEILGYNNYNEADHPLHMDLSGRCVSEGIIKVLEISNRAAEDVGYFCGHGTSTHYNDLSESRAIRQFYKIQRTSNWAPVGSVKPIFGHIFGASAIVNVAASSLMIH
ncbi:MAG: beta-ketoacyl-[acyl-carrier-protein] synthase family protein, partial [Leptospira sp.]|nr:beta-ketoacyl-[acyl-carrier-protein] synthase family protein [Leptospira sp.]